MMKTAEQAAKRYADTQCMDGTAYKAFLAGVEWADEWIPVEDEMLEENVCVLLKVADELDNEAIYLGSREGDEYMTDGGLVFGTDFDNESMPDMNTKVVGWRPIEHK